LIGFLVDAVVKESSGERWRIYGDDTGINLFILSYCNYGRTCVYANARETAKSLHITVIFPFQVFCGTIMNFFYHGSVVCKAELASSFRIR
jgi:hypothetical protein